MKNIKNKIYATILIGLGVLATTIDGDATFLVVMLLMGVPMFISKKSWF